MALITHVSCPLPSCQQLTDDEPKLATVCDMSVVVGGGVSVVVVRCDVGFNSWTVRQ